MHRLPLEILLLILENLTPSEIIKFYPNLFCMRPSILINHPSVLNIDKIIKEYTICNCIHEEDPYPGLYSLYYWETFQKCNEYSKEILEKVFNCNKIITTGQKIYEKEKFLNLKYGIPFPNFGDIMKEIELYGDPYDIQINISSLCNDLPFTTIRESNITKINFIYPIILQRFYEPRIIFKGEVNKIIFKSYYLLNSLSKAIINADVLHFTTGNKSFFITPSIFNKDFILTII